MNDCKAKALVITLATVAMVLPGTLQAAMEHDVVRHGGDNKTVNSFNNCVRTNWSAGTDPCAPPAPEPAPAPVAPPPPKPRIIIGKEERTIYFEFNKASLTPDALQRLESLATKLKADTQIKQAKVVGFADRIGSDSYNERLSQKRAETVKEFIISRGFAKMGATETRWFGESTPATDCPEKMKRQELVECLAKDRRVEVEIEYQTEVLAGQ